MYGHFDKEVNLLTLCFVNLVLCGHCLEVCWASETGFWKTMQF